jgi:small-conductance mechanosensitive channel
MPQLLTKIPIQGIFSPWATGPFIVLLGVVVLLRLKKRILNAIGARLKGGTGWIWAESLIKALSPALSIASVAGGLALLDRILPLSTRTDHTFAVVLTGLVILALVTFLDRITRHLLLQLAASSVTLRGALGLLQGATRGAIIALGVLVFLDSVGISITPIVASLGIGSLAIALALQDTLANLFAGVYMIAEKPIEPGNFVKLEGGEQGYITKVGWRSTHIRTLGDHVVVVPNAKLAGSVIANFSLPRDEIGVSLEIGVDYNSNLEQVERVTLEVAQAVTAQVPEANPDFAPRVRFHSFGDSSINLSVWLGARDFTSGFVVQHEFIKRLHVRYRTEQIAMPFPTRTLDLTAASWAALRELVPPPNGKKSLNGDSPAAGEITDRAV